MLTLSCEEKDNKIKLLEVNAFESSQIIEQKGGELCKAVNVLMCIP